MTNKNPIMSRRSAAGLLGLMGVSAVGAAVATGASQAGQVAMAAGVSNPMPGHDMMLQPIEYIQSDPIDADAMDAMHEAGVKAFPAQTKGLGGQPLDYVMDGDVKVFTLTADVVEWEFMPGKTVEAWTYNGVTPGPEIRVTEGDKVRIWYICRDAWGDGSQANLAAGEFKLQLYGGGTPAPSPDLSAYFGATGTAFAGSDDFINTASTVCLDIHPGSSTSRAVVVLWLDGANDADCEDPSTLTFENRYGHVWAPSNGALNDDGIYFYQSGGTQTPVVTLSDATVLA